jgi:hypothetical protein
VSPTDDDTGGDDNHRKHGQDTRASDPGGGMPDSRRGQVTIWDDNQLLSVGRTDIMKKSLDHQGSK